MKTIKQIVIGCLLVVGIVFGYNLWMEYCLDDSNPNNYATIGDIPAPEGYIRVKQVLSLRSRTQLRRSHNATEPQLESYAQTPPRPPATPPLEGRGAAAPSFAEGTP